MVRVRSVNHRQRFSAVNNDALAYSLHFLHDMGWKAIRFWFFRRKKSIGEFLSIGSGPILPGSSKINTSGSWIGLVPIPRFADILWQGGYFLYILWSVRSGYDFIHAGVAFTSFNAMYAGNEIQKLPDIHMSTYKGLCSGRYPDAFPDFHGLVKNIEATHPAVPSVGGRKQVMIFIRVDFPVRSPQQTHDLTLWNFQWNLVQSFCVP